MESMRRNLRMQQCNFTSHGSSPRAARRVLSEPHEPVIPVSSLVKDCHEIPITVKVEHDNEDLVSYRALQEGGAYLREASVTDIGSLAKEEDNSIMQTEEKMIEVTVKQELDIGPMVLQPKSMPCQFSSPILDCYEIPVTMKLECDHEDFITYQEPHVVQARLREAAVADIGQLVKEKNDFIRKIEGETVEMTVKQELDIGPMVLQPNIMFCQRPAPTLPSLPDPSSSWTGDVSPALPYLVSRVPKTNAQRCKDYYKRNQAEKRKRAAERVRAHRLRRRTISERSGTSACGPSSATLNSDVGVSSSGTSRRPAPNTPNGISFNNANNKVDDNTWNSPLSTPAQDHSSDVATQAVVHMQSSPRLCDRRIS